MVLYRDRYLVSPCGHVYDNQKKRWLKLNKNSKGYVQAFIHGRLTFVHRIVAFCYHGDPDGQKEIDHIDRNSGNNFFGNLEWVTHQENMRRYVVARFGERVVRVRKNKVGRPKLKEDVSKTIYREQKFATPKGEVGTKSRNGWVYGTRRGPYKGKADYSPTSKPVMIS